MTGKKNIKRQVREFYDRVGWQAGEEGLYQNARYEDLRPVSHEYIRRCHLRVGRFLKPSGRYLLDAGSGPVQYPEYMTYSQGYTYRVCADISIVALQEARKRLNGHGLYVVSDVAHLPFKKDAFGGVVSLHTLHHLPTREHLNAIQEIYRVLAHRSSAVVVNGWTYSGLMRRFDRVVHLMERAGALANRLKNPFAAGQDASSATPAAQPKADAPTGTFVKKFTADWVKQNLDGKIDYEIRTWRSVSVRFLRAVIQPRLGGRVILRALFWLEDLFPHWLGIHGQYPLVVLKKH